MNAATELEGGGAATTFSDLISDQEIINALAKQNIHAPMPVQAAMLPDTVAGHDVIVQAQTGSGKTLGYSLPLVLKLKANPDLRHTVGLIIAPTRELAIQVCNVIAGLTSDIKPVCVIGGTSMQQQIDGLNSDRRIIVGTPGRLLDLIQRREVVLRKCSYFVLDEADEMLSMGFLEEVRTILSRLPDKRQGLFISATITPRVSMLARSFLTRPKNIVIASDSGTAPEIEHLYCECEGGLTGKVTALCDLIETQRPRSAVVFCNTKSDTETVEVFLRRRGFDARRINSDLTQKQRDQIMQKIRAGDLQILIATDVAARGIDIEQIDLVVNYVIHSQPEVYVHRTGRTGRAGRSGRAICLVGPQDGAAFHLLRKSLSNIEFKKLELPPEEELDLARLTHFYELVRERKLQPSERELRIARKLIADLGGIADPSEEFVDMAAKLNQLALQSLVLGEAQSLEAEMAEHGSGHSGEGHSSDDSRHGGRHDRHGRESRGSGGGRSGSRGGGGRGGRSGGRRGGDRYGR